MKVNVHARKLKEYQDIAYSNKIKYEKLLHAHNKMKEYNNIIVLDS